MSDDDAQRLEARVRSLEQRFDQLRISVRRIVGVIGAIAALLVLIVPFYTGGSDRKPLRVWLWVLGRELVDSGDGPNRGLALMAGLVGWFVLAGAIAALVASVLLAAREASRKGLIRILLVVGSVGAAGAWILLILLAGHFDDSGLHLSSPGPILMTLSVALGWCSFALREHFRG